MGMFSAFAEASGLGASGYLNEADLAEEMDRLEAMPAAEMEGDIEDMYVEAMVANEKNLNTIMMSVVAEEYQYLLENGTEMVYEGAKLDAFFDKVKSFLDKAWQKIRSIFDKALNNIKAWTATDAKFVQKYKKQIEAATGNICKIADSYKIDKSILTDNVYSDVATNMRGVIDKKKKGAEVVRKKEGTDWISKNIYGDYGKTREEALIEYKNKIGLGKKDVVDISGKEVVAELENGKTNKNNIKIWYNDAKKAIASMKKQVEDAKREAAKKSTVDDSSSSYSHLLKGCNQAISYMSGLQSLQLQAAKVYHSNCRTIARRIVSGKTYSEGAEMSDFADLLA